MTVSIQLHQKRENLMFGNVYRRVPLDTRSSFSRLKARIRTWPSRHCIDVLRISISVVYLWFGSLKFMANASPAEQLAVETISRLTLSLINPQLERVLLASFECAIGVGLLTPRLLPLSLLAVYAHMLGTLTTLFLFPSRLFLHFPYAPTLEGQYVLKNLILVAGALVVSEERQSRRARTEAGA